MKSPMLCDGKPVPCYLPGKGERVEAACACAARKFVANKQPKTIFIWLAEAVGAKRGNWRRGGGRCGALLAYACRVHVWLLLHFIYNFFFLSFLFFVVVGGANLQDGRGCLATARPKM